MKNYRNKQFGFTLMEIMVFLAIFSVVIVSVLSFFMWTSRSYYKINAAQEVLTNISRAMNVITNEIKLANDIYGPTTANNQLSLVTDNELPVGESSTYVDIFNCDGRICLKREGAPPVAITSNEVVVETLSFTQIATTSVPSIEIVVKLKYNTDSPRPDYQSSMQANSVASLRDY